MQRITAGRGARHSARRVDQPSAHGGAMLKRLPLVVPIVLFTGALVALSPLDAFAATAPNLGTALNFTVLAGATVTNTGPSVITGNLGLDPGSSVTGFPPGTVTGVQHISDAV